jgi:hypothetical protein
MRIEEYDNLQTLIRFDSDAEMLKIANIIYKLINNDLTPSLTSSNQDYIVIHNDLLKQLLPIIRKERIEQVLND